MTLPSFLFVSLLVLLVANKYNCAAQTINLGECVEFAVMAGAAETCAGAPACNVVNGYIGISPGTSITGNWHTDSRHAGKQVNSAKSNACARNGLAALKQGASLSGKTLASGVLAGKTFTRGVYKYMGALTIPSGKVYLDARGNGNAKFVFYATTTLTTAAGTQIVLKNGAKAANVYWILGTAATLGANSVLRGTVLAGSAITIGTGAKIYGRAIAQTAVTCETACTVTKP